MFHSPAEELREHATGLPFDLVADPEKVLYREWGVESGSRALLSLGVWPVIARAVVAGLRRRDRMPSLSQPNGRLGLPADFLIAPGGKVVASKRGKHAYDQWSVDEILGHASTLV
ncbi:hypothetical protein GCM10009539_24300 [Cryptosporangium japonicum]|uniref:Alkyl hydroperoxide reductase subunit C/ Thiol specific antioxidant domain-containing protein n=1 Tax=Cryptosporangium japonicum TaxID=80872 RepID=A0ABN0U483_9ACTN